MNLKDFKSFTFPGGERHFQIDSPPPLSDYLVAHLRNSDDIMSLMLVTSYLKEHNRQPPNLYLPYIPYARQDRATTEGSPFSLKVFAGMLNSLEYQKVHVYEPHSDVASALINNCRVVHMDNPVKQFMQDCGDQFTLVAPDASATKRVQRITDDAFVQAIKRRDPATGKLFIEIITGEIAGRACLIIDDICDGGATFIPLAQWLTDCGAKSVSLFVAHGLFSKGFEHLEKAGISRFGTTDSFYEQQSRPNLRVYKAF